MAKFREKIEKSFFLISSDMDLITVQSRLYGVCYMRGGGILKDSSLSEAHMAGVNGGQSGCFIAVKNDGNRIVLEQDCCFSLCIYYYQNNGYWAVSNSFWILCDEVKKQYPLTLDEIYFEQFSSTDVATVSLKHTLANEIKVCPFGFNVSIGISDKRLDFRKNQDVLAQLIQKTPLDSLEGIKRLDKWISRWASVIRGIERGGFEMKFDLTGGYDSRITFALAIASKIKLDSRCIHFFSRKVMDNEGNIIEDFRIASRIAEEFGITLSDQFLLESAKEIRGEDAHEIYRQVLSHVHREPYQPRHYYQKPVFFLNGYSGEIIRGWRKGRRDRAGFIKSFRYPAGVASKTYYPVAAWKELMSDWESLPVFSKNPQLNEIEQSRYFYLVARNKTHMASMMYQNNILNLWQVTNFADLDILNIGIPDGYAPTVIAAVILNRIDKRLLSFPISDKRSFSKEEIAYAEYIEQKYTVNIAVDERDYQFFSDDMEANYEISLDNNITPEKFLYDRFLREDGKRLFLEHFGEWGSMLYADAKENHFRGDIKFQDQYIAVVGTVMEMLMIQNESRRYYGNNMVRDDLHILKELINKYPENETIQYAYEKLSLAEKKKQRTRDEETELKKKLQSAWDEKTELRKKLQRAWGEKSELRERLQTVWNEESELRKKLQAAWDEKTELREKLQAAWREKLELTKKLQSARNKESELRKKLQTAWDEKSELNNKLKKTYAEKSEINAKLQKTYKEKAERGLEIQRLSAEMDGLRKENSLLKSTLSSIR